MPSSRRLITSTTLSSSAASVTFSSIPNTFTDLVLKVSARTDRASTADALKITINSDSTSLYSFTSLYGNGSNANSTRTSNTTAARAYYTDAANSTSDTFGNIEVYFPSYTTSANKVYSSFGAEEENSALAYLQVTAGLYRNTSAITSLLIVPNLGSNFVSGSSFFLYGIKNS